MKPYNRRLLLSCYMVDMKVSFPHFETRVGFPRLSAPDESSDKRVVEHLKILGDRAHDQVTMLTKSKPFPGNFGKGIPLTFNHQDPRLVV